ncbi:jg841 [Pararge aegeria aegeria]|uniref:Jg841 protein n=1 Tax=Pararge aegeria aegeria TaxID=348720 RepID=A0A8S4S423_9NEOP|nr:jg841 [Pararge aegeria aegeria]
MLTDEQNSAPDPGFWTKTSLIQLLYGIWATSGMIIIGLAYGFSAVTIPQLRSPESQIKVTVTEESWIGRIITGIGLGMLTSVPRIYLTEISLPNMRGVLGSFGNIAISIGITAQNSKLSVDAHVANVILGFTRTVGGICTSVLMFRVRRRVMALTSGLGVGTACIVLGILIKYAEESTAMPLILYVLYILFATFGHYTLPILMMYELYPLQLRGLLGGISSSTLNILISGVNWSYPHMRDSIGYAYTITCFGVCSLAGLVVNYPDPGFWTRTSLIQLGYGIWVNLTMVSIGLAYGFSAVAIPQLKAPDSSIKVSISDESWIASIITLFAPIGCILGGYLIDKFGRRTMLIYCHVPLVFGWFYTGMASTPRDIILGRVVIGFGIGLALSAPRVYMTEVCLPNMRGIVGSFPNLAMATGITIQAGLGSILKWSFLCHLNASYALILFIINLKLPETPYFMLKHATISDAEDCLRNFRAKSYNLEAELNDLVEFKHDNEICKLTFKQQLAALCKRSSCKPFWLMTTYTLFGELSGASIVSMWTVDLLQNTKSTVNADLGNFILGITRIIAGLFGGFLIFHTGRRPLAISSALGAGVVYVTIGVLTIYWDKASVVPQILFMFYVLFVGMCFYTLPPLILYELYPLQVRGLLGGITISNLNIFVFTANKCYPYLRNLLGFAHLIIAFGTASLLCCIFLYFFLPETKDLTLQEIEEYYNSRRSTLTSERRLRSIQAINTLKVTPSSSKITDRHKKPRNDKVPIIQNKND